VPTCPLSKLTRVLEGNPVVARTRTAQRVRIGSVAAIALAAAFVTWLFVRPDSDAAPAAQRANAPKLASEAELRGIAAKLRYPVYWAAPRRGMRYELTEAGSRTYVRYLPRSVRAGDPRPRFLTVGTYAGSRAFARTRAAGQRHGAVTLRLGAGGIAVYSRAHPTSVYFAYPGAGVQVEVYDPDAQVALALVLRHRVVPIG
jgi:hypothetical protein